MKNEKKCTGCGACVYYCPVNAITIKEDDYVFYRHIDNNKCINCGLCRELCHVEHRQLQPSIVAYTAESQDFVYRKIGASGGIASSIYKYGIKNGYYCIGAIYEDGQVRYKIIDSERDIKRTSGSKYVISHLENIYKETENLSNTHRRIIFIGLPCHCATMKRILHNIADNIIWIDIVCHGVCPERDLIEDLKKHHLDIKEIGDIRFREKNNQYGLTIRNKSENIIKKIEKSKDEYMCEFEKGNNIYKHCIDCQYACSERVGDITLKDYAWKYGVSNVIINSEKGIEFWKQITPYVYSKEYPIEKVQEDDERIR